MDAAAEPTAGVLAVVPTGGGICIPMDPGTYDNFIKHKIHVNNVFYL
jgi:hypothetical protein